MESPVKKQSGFTLIELMVVMAIIAILATAGLSAYSGYLKKSRDTTRIRNLATLNNVVLSMMANTGTPPAIALDVYNAAMTSNNGIPIVDPLTTVSSGITTNKSLCMDSTGTSLNKECSYTYRICDNGTGYAVGTRFESASNIGLYTSDSPDTAGASLADNVLYEIGSCRVGCSGANNPVGCPAATYFNATKLECNTTYVAPNCTVGATAQIGS